jgi:hypothetical protein
VNALYGNTGSELTFDIGGEKMRITSAGNIGIGTSSPASNLDVFSSAGGEIRFGNASGTGRLIANGGGAYIGSYSNHPVIFQVNQDEKMRINTSGNVGIGTASPNGKLTVSGSITAFTTGVTDQFIATPQTAGSGVLLLAVNDANNVYRDMTIGGSTNIFQTSGTERARIDASGNLSIGFAGSAAKLNINQSLSGTSGSAGVWVTDNATTSLLMNNISNGLSGIWGSGDLAFGTGSSNFAERVRIGSTGNFLVGATSLVTSSQAGVRVGPTGFIEISRGSGTDSWNVMSFINGNSTVGTINTNGTATTYNTSSDYRLKDIDGPIINSGAYIDALKPVQGSWKASGSRFIGLLAHEVQEVSETPIATGEKDGEEMQAMDYSAPEIIANLIAELQSLRARVAQLEGN